METKNVEKQSKIPCLMPSAKIQQQAEALSEMLKLLPKTTVSSPRLSRPKGSRIPQTSKTPSRTSPRSTSSLQDQPPKITKPLVRPSRPKAVKVDLGKPLKKGDKHLPGTPLPESNTSDDAELLTLDISADLLLAEDSVTLGMTELDNKSTARSVGKLASTTPRSGRSLKILSDRSPIVVEVPKKEVKVSLPTPKTKPEQRKVPLKTMKNSTSDKVKPVSDTVTDMVTFLVENWMNMTEKIAHSRLQIVDTFFARKLEPTDIDRIKAESNFIEQEMDRARSSTKEKISLVTEYLSKIFETGAENEKLRKSQKQQNTRIAHLNVQLKNNEEQLKTARATAEKDKIHYESKMARLITDTENIKRSLQRQLKEKTSSLQKITAELASSKLENEKLRTEIATAKIPKGPPSVTEEHSKPKVEENAQKEMAPYPIQPNEDFREKSENHLSTMTMCKGNQVEMTEESHFRKQIKVLKYTVKKLEQTVETLATQNAELRRLVTQSQSIVGIDGDGEGPADPLSERGVARALTSILHEKHRDVQKLADILRMMQRHCTAAHLQRSNLESRIKDLHRQVRTKHY